MKQLIDKLRSTHTLSKDEWIALIERQTPELAGYAPPAPAKCGSQSTEKTSISAG